jgi:Flp pilus assembly protein TadG
VRSALLRRLLTGLRRDRRGVSTIEFAFAAPIFILLVVGAAQMGRLFYAHTSLRHAVAEGARFATIDPRPDRTAIVARINAQRSASDAANYGAPTVTFARDAASQDCLATIRMTYRITLDFIFYRHGPITLDYERQTWVQSPLTASAANPC